MHINSLPDLVLRLTFDKLPLRDLFNASRVCLLWRSYQMEACEKVHSLTLLIGSSNAHQLIADSCFTFKYRDILLNDDGTRMYSSQHLSKHFHLTCGSFTSKSPLYWSSTFPHITTLEISISILVGQTVLAPIVTLLSRWSSCLKSLKIYLKFNNLSKPHDPTLEDHIAIANLLKMINLMPVLEHLTLDIGYLILYILIRTNCKELDFPILGRLKEFYMKTNDYHLNYIEKSMQIYAVPNHTLKQIGIEYNVDRQDGPFPQLASRIVYIPCSPGRYLPATSPDTLKQFSSLVYLRFCPSFTENLFKGALNSLASLRQLTHLHYDSNCLYSREFSRNNLHQLASVQVLIVGSSIPIQASNHDLMARLNAIKYNLTNKNWAYLFPNVQVIQLYLQSPVDYTKICKSLFTFVQCPKLHHIFTVEIEDGADAKIREWTVGQSQVCDVSLSGLAMLSLN